MEGFLPSRVYCSFNSSQKRRFLKLILSNAKTFECCIALFESTQKMEFYPTKYLNSFSNIKLEFCPAKVIIRGKSDSLF